MSTMARTGPGLGPGIHPDFPYEWQGLSFLCHHLLPLRVGINRKMESGAKPRLNFTRLNTHFSDYVFVEQLPGKERENQMKMNDDECDRIA